MQRRALILALMAAGTLAATSSDAQIIRRRLRRRRRIRRRIRRRVILRTMFGRPVWVVPVGLVVGWELVHQNRVVVVTETHYVERDGHRVEIARVRDESGHSEEVEIAREDLAENREDLKGSVLPEDDHATPGVDDEIEEEQPA